MLQAPAPAANPDAQHNLALPAANFHHEFPLINGQAVNDVMPIRPDTLAGAATTQDAPGFKGSDMPMEQPGGAAATPLQSAACKILSAPALTKDAPASARDPTPASALCKPTNRAPITTPELISNWPQPQFSPKDSLPVRDQSWSSPASNSSSRSGSMSAVAANDGTEFPSSESRVPQPEKLYRVKAEIQADSAFEIDGDRIVALNISFKPAAGGAFGDAPEEAMHSNKSALGSGLKKILSGIQVPLKRLRPLAVATAALVAANAALRLRKV